METNKKNLNAINLLPCGAKGALLPTRRTAENISHGSVPVTTRVIRLRVSISPPELTNDRVPRKGFARVTGRERIYRGPENRWRGRRCEFRDSRPSDHDACRLSGFLGFIFFYLIPYRCSSPRMNFRYQFTLQKKKNTCEI